MIVREEGGDLVLVRQADHGLLSGWLAAAWGSPPWTPAEPYESTVVGARLHDLAWTSFDEALPCRPDGRPYAFNEVSRSVTTELYGRGIDAVEAIDGYAGLLTSLHFSGFLTSHWGWTPLASRADLPPDEQEAVDRFLLHELGRQERLRDRLGVEGAGGSRLRCNYFWLQLWDRISLDICRHGFTGWSGDYPRTPVATAEDAETVSLHIELRSDCVCRLDPYPLLSNQLRARVPAVRVPLSAVGDQAALKAAWRSSHGAAIEVVFSK